MSNWGVCTDAEAVENLWLELCRLTQELQIKILPTGLLVDDKQYKFNELPEGQKKLKLIRQLIEQHYPDKDNIPHSPPSKKFQYGQIQTGEAVLSQCDFEPFQWLVNFDRYRKVANTYLTKLKQPVVHAYFNGLGAITTRTSCSNPNLQNPPRAAGVRECIIPRPNHDFCACDYDTQEVRTLAQCCLDLLKQSRIAERYQQDRFFDPHTEFAASLMGISVEDAQRRKKEKDPELKEFRQRSKAANFGFPGGMGAAKLVSYAKGYNVNLSIDEAQELRQHWFQQWPEMYAYFNHIQDIVGPASCGEQTYPRSGVRRGHIGYCDAANGYFQGLAAHASKTALFDVSKKCYKDTN